MARATGHLLTHAVCAVAGARDGLRTTQFLVRVLSGADRWGRQDPHDPQMVLRRSLDAGQQFDLLNTLVARLARLADRVMTVSVNAAIALVVPDWRKLPSPFTHEMMGNVAQAMQAHNLLFNPLFNAYFYRAAIHILRRYRTPPFLVLEHRVDAARRVLVQSAEDAAQDPVVFLARALIALAAAAPIARAGGERSPNGFLSDVEPNIAVYATACIALLFAEEGRLAQELDEDQFFAVVSALIRPRLGVIAAAVADRDEARLIGELIEIKAIY
ncbi:hypothetical protein BH10PSE7_BH10PSE7_16110 [soil metagenome]